jgi:type II secretory pathway component PulJ
MRGGDVQVTYLVQRLRRDAGFTLIEVAIAGLLSTILLVAMGSFILSAVTAGSFTQGQSATLNDARNVVQRIEKESRGANAIEWCEPVGSCLEIDSQTPTGSFRLVRYLHAEGQLHRQEFDADAAEWSDTRVVIERLKNTAEQPVFSNSACDAESITLQRVIVDLYIEPTPASDPSLNVQTSFRPRNFPSVATCPGS